MDMNEQAWTERMIAALKTTKVSGLAVLGDDVIYPVTIWHHLCYRQETDPVAFRAAWLLEYIAYRYPDRFSTVLPVFLQAMHEQRNVSCQRHFTKILMRVTSRSAPDVYRDHYRQADRERLVETIFGWLIDPETPVAVQVNCMDILFNMRNEFDWLGEELRNQIRFLMRDGSAAMQSRGRKLLDRFERSLKSEG